MVTIQRFRAALQNPWVALPKPWVVLAKPRATILKHGRTMKKGGITMRYQQAALAIFLALTSLISAAETRLEASVDRQQIYQNDSLNFRISGNIEMDFSFGGLLDFGRNQLNPPDLSALANDFEILDQQQNYNMQTINGKTNSQVTWNYVLAPKRSGQLVIPKISYQDAETQEIVVDVKPGSAPKDVDNPPLVFLEVEVDKSKVYVQEQVIYTMRLFAADHLASGEWSEPAPLDAIVESIGETQKFYRMAYNQRYEVREKKYLLFPQKSGELTIDAQSFRGVLIDTRSRRRVRVNELSDALTIDVKAPPAEFSGTTWLPAASFELTERWDVSPDNIAVGDSLTRTLEIQTLGLLGSALPPLPQVDLDGIKLYPDQADVVSNEHQMGVQSRRAETTALVAISPGQVTLPEIKIPWWDTVNDVERVAIVPSRELNIEAGAAPTSSSTTVNGGQVPTPSTSESSLNMPQPLSEDLARDNQGAEFASTSPEDAAGKHQNQLSQSAWLSLIALILFAWAGTSWLLWQRGNQRLVQADELEPYQDELALDDVIKSIQNLDTDMPRKVVEWVQQRFPGKPIRSIGDLKAISSELADALNTFEHDRYAPSSDQGFEKQALVNTLKQLNKEGSSSKDSSDDVLMPLYP